MRKKKILVTGGAGFLGSHLCEKLLELGHQVICVDNFSTGAKKNINHLLSHPCFSLIEHDICHALYVEVEEIYNLASLASPFHYQRDPIATWKTNVLGSLHMLELAKRNRAKILQASTSEVYGDPLMHPQKEEYWGNVNPVGVRACYDEGKRAAETLFFDFYRQFKTPIKVVRLFNTYGPKMQLEDGRVVSNLIRQALEGKDLTIYGDGKQTRSFCYVADIIDALIAMMDSDVWVLGPVNLGNPEEYSVKDLAKIIAKMTNSSSKIFYGKIMPDDPKQRKPDIQKARELLDWKPKVSLSEGLEKTIAYFQKVLEGVHSHCEEDAFLSL